MPRRSPFVAHQSYLITNHGSQRLFQTSRDYETFLEEMILTQVNFPTLRFLAYSLVPEQFFFVIQPLETGYEISKWMKALQVSYVLYCKKTKSELFPEGTSVFPERFETHLLDSEEVFLKTLSWVNYAPKHLGYVDQIKDRPYSSIHQYLSTGYKDQKKTHCNVFGHGYDIKQYKNQTSLPFALS